MISVEVNEVTTQSKSPTRTVGSLSPSVKRCPVIVISVVWEPDTELGLIEETVGPMFESYVKILDNFAL